MYRFLALMSALAVTTGCFAPYTPPAKQPLVAPLEHRIDRLVGELGNTSWRIREEATVELKKMVRQYDSDSEAITQHLKRHLACAVDPEVITRLERLTYKDKVVRIMAGRSGKGEVVPKEYLVDELLQYFEQLTGCEAIPEPSAMGRRIKIWQDIDASAKTIESILNLNLIALEYQLMYDRAYYLAYRERTIRHFGISYATWKAWYEKNKDK